MKLTPEIQQIKKLNEEINSGAKNILAKCIKAGELLTNIKTKTKHGDWRLVVESIEMDWHTADRYMFLWEHRGRIDLQQVKTLKDAIRLLTDNLPKIGTIPITTSQNEALTHEKTPNSKAHSQAKSSTENQRSVRDFRTVSRETETPKSRPSSFDSDQIPRNNVGAYLSRSVESSKPETNGAPEIRHDKTGYPIPKELASEWDRASDQANGWIRAFDAIHRQVMEAYGQDFAVAHINKASIEALHSNYRETLKQAVPYAVCGTCQGREPANCKSCNPEPKNKNSKGLGWVNKHFWENCTPVEIQKMREKNYGTNSSARLSA